MKNTHALAVVVVLIAAFLSPLMTIWALNTLFKFTIPYTLWTYIAALWLSMIVYGSKVRSER